MNNRLAVGSRHGWLVLASCLVIPALAAAQQLQPLRATTGPERFESAIAAFEAADRATPPPKNATLFIGASNIRRWESLATDVRTQPLLNRGFGGAWLRDVLHYADRVILPYEPKTIVLQAGGNDLHGGRSPDEVLADFRSLVAKIHARLPRTTITLLGIPPSEARWKETDKIRTANRLLSDYAASDERLAFIDVFPYMLGPDERPRAELFHEDRLHVNERGYRVWASLIRWHKEIAKLLAADKLQPPPAEGIVFIGSSSIRRWTTLREDFPDLPVVNHGFGGSQVFDSVVFAEPLVLSLKPRLVVVYAGGNDIHAGLAPTQVAADFRELATKIHAQLPATRIAYISIAGNPARWAEVEQVREANRLIAEFTRTDPRLTYIDVHSHMLGSDGLPLPHIFVSDRLHMNAEGYRIWKEQIGTHLRSIE